MENSRTYKIYNTHVIFKNKVLIFIEILIYINILPANYDFMCIYYYLKNKKIYVRLIRLNKRELNAYVLTFKFMKQKSKHTYVSIPHALLAELKYSTNVFKLFSSSLRVQRPNHST